MYISDVRLKSIRGVGARGFEPEVHLHPELHLEPEVWAAVTNGTLDDAVVSGL